MARTIQLLAALALVLSGIPANICLAQDDALLLRLRKQLQASLPQSPDARDRLAFFKTPRLLSNDKILSSELKSFDFIASLDDNAVISFDKNSISAVLSKVAPSVTIGERTLSAEDKRELTAARAILFEQPDAEESPPSLVYKKYKQYADEYAKLIKPPDGPETAAEKAVRLQKVRRLEQDWQLLGSRTRIEQALNAVEALSGGVRETRQLYDDWQKVIKDYSPGTPESVWKGFDAPSGWTALIFEDGPILTELRRHDGNEQHMERLSVQSIAFRYKVITIAHPALSHPFLARNNWKFKDGGILSDGEPRRADQEMLPQFLSQLVIGHMFEVRFAEGTKVDGLRDAIIASENVSLGGIPLRSSSEGSVFVASRYLCVTDPYILAGIVSQLSKTPNPSTKTTW